MSPPTERSRPRQEGGPGNTDTATVPPEYDDWRQQLRQRAREAARRREIRQQIRQQFAAARAVGLRHRYRGKLRHSGGGHR